MCLVVGIMDVMYLKSIKYVYYSVSGLCGLHAGSEPLFRGMQSGVEYCFARFVCRRCVIVLRSVYWEGLSLKCLRVFVAVRRRRGEDCASGEAFVSRSVFVLCGI